METVKKHTISDIMTEQLYLLNETDSLQKASSMFNKYNVRHFPVVTDHKIVGMLSQTDIERLCFDSSTLSNFMGQDATFLSDVSVGDVMRKKPVCVDYNAELFSTARKLANQEFHAFPVVKLNKELVGIVTTTDVINYLVDQMDLGTVDIYKR